MQEDNKAKYMFPKHMLNLWGKAIQICEERNERIEELKQLCKDTGDIQSLRPKETPSKRNFSSRIENSVIKTIEIYEKTILKLENDVEETLRIKASIDSWISFQEREEQQILTLRYRDGLSWDYIPDMVHRSRMQCFRIHNKALDKLSKDRPWAS